MWLGIRFEVHLSCLSRSAVIGNNRDVVLGYTNCLHVLCDITIFVPNGVIVYRPHWPFDYSSICIIVLLCYEFV